MALLEIACFSPENAIIAWNAGADRIELCHDRELGGTTPSLDALLYVKAKVTIPVFVMIRPRGGDFNYSDSEFQHMKADIEAFKSNVDGYVLGILDEQRHVDILRTRELVLKAYPHPCTFHRAFDEIRKPLQALEDVIDTGCKAILSSGGPPNAESAANELRELVQLAQKRITIIPGGGIRADNLLDLYGMTKADVYHSSAIGRGQENPDSAAIRRMKMLLCEPPRSNIIPFDVAAEPNPNLQLRREDSDEGYSRMEMSAVSIGADMPIDELTRNLR